MPKPNNQPTLLKLVEVSLHFAQHTILDSVNFELRNKEVIGIVGRNGSGKSSFLKILAGVDGLDSGKIEYANETKLVYVSQDGNLISSDQHHYQEEHGKLENLSGGEKRQISLNSAFEIKPDILILDEPTNHLDIIAIQKLEEKIKSFEGGVVLVSHDRYFLDNIVTRMVEIRDGKLFNHYGNYQDYLESKAVRLEIELTQDDRKNAFLKRELNWVRAGVSGRGTKDKGRMDRYNNLKNEKGVLKEEEPNLLLPPTKPLGNKVINLENLEVQIGEKTVVKDLNLMFQPKTILGVVGANGSGKTTLIKTILGQILPKKGRVIVGLNTEFNYQDQEKQHLNIHKTPFEEIGEGQETTDFGEGKVGTRNYLKRFLFTNNQMISSISNFSGGEKARLLLAKVLKKGGNCLILDEPTNDLDLETISALEESLLNFEGVAILVSHDRYFLNQVCNKILSLEGDGYFILCDGNYENLLVEKKKIESLFDISSLKVEDQNLKVKQPHPKKIQKEIQKEINKIESRISKVEIIISGLEKEFNHPEFYLMDLAKMKIKNDRYDELKVELAKLLEDWEGLSGKI